MLPSFKSQPAKEEATVVLLDAHALIHRSYHALPPLTSPKGEMVNAVYGVATVLLRVIRELSPTHMAACFDLPGPTFRHKEFKPYKAHRPPTPAELVSQVELVRELFKSFGIPIYEKLGFEADDILGTIVTKLRSSVAPFPRPPENRSSFPATTHHAPRAKIIIITGDMDTLQLVDEAVFVYTLRRSVQDTVVYDQGAVEKRYGFSPERLPDFKGLRGDSSDNIPGVPGIGEKTATALLKKFVSLEGLYEAVEQKSKVKSQNTKPQSKTQKSPVLKGLLTETLLERLLKYKEQSFLSKGLATIKRDVPIAFTLDDIKWFYDAVPAISAFFMELGFRSLVNRLLRPAGGKAEKYRQIKAEQSSLFSPPRSPPVVEEIERLFRAGAFSPGIRALELELTPVIEAMQENGILVDVRALRALARAISKNMTRLEKNIATTAGEQFNVLSPQQLSKVLFEKLGIPTQGLRKTPGGVISTQSSELAKIRELHPLIVLVEQYRELAKLKSTYIDALPLLVNPQDGRVHTTYKQLGADTGRIASIEPNLQNIPIRSALGKKIRRAFIAPPGYLFVSADYSQIELRIAAVISQDETLLEAFKRGEDIHTTTAAQVFGASESAVTPDMRRQAKVINFGVLYGMGIQGLAEAADITRPEAKNFIDAYFRSFPGIAKYVAGTKHKAHELGYVETLFGRKRYVVGLDSQDPRIRAAAERAAVNAPIQGGAADIIKMAMVAIVKEFPPKEPNLRLLLQVHDELVFEIKKDLVQSVAPRIKKIMESIVKFPIPFVVGMKAGRNWEEMEPL